MKDEAAREKRLNEILFFGKDPKKYKPQTLPQRNLRLVLYNQEDSPIAYSLERFDSEKEAQQRIKTLASFFDQLGDAKKAVKEGCIQLPEYDFAYYPASQPLASPEPEYTYVETYTDVKEDPAEKTSAFFKNIVSFQPVEPNDEIKSTDKAFVFSSEDPAILMEVMNHGTIKSNYEIVESKKKPGKFRVLFKTPHPVLIKGEKDAAMGKLVSPCIEIYQASSEKEAKAAIICLIEYLKALPQDTEKIYQGEGFYVVEHILLRPTSAADAGKKKSAKDQNVKAKDAFYAFKVSVFLPNWPARFQNSAFRDFAERVIRENCPAHVAAQFYWLGIKKMARFEATYHAWVKARTHTPRESAELDRLADELKTFIE